MIQHSPGPWTDDTAEHDQPYMDIRILSANGHTICRVLIDDAPVEDYNREQRANAALIKAGPEMLATLKGCIAALSGEYPWFVNSGKFTQKEAREAAKRWALRTVAAAEGRPIKPCDGNHALPECRDPSCWHKPS